MESLLETTIDPCVLGFVLIIFLVRLFVSHAFQRASKSLVTVMGRALLLGMAYVPCKMVILWLQYHRDTTVITLTTAPYREQPLIPPSPPPEEERMIEIKFSLNCVSMPGHGIIWIVIFALGFYLGRLMPRF